MRVLDLERRGEQWGGTLGYLTHGHRFLAYTLERPWLDNRRNISCIPLGEYECHREKSARFGRVLYELHDVPGRSELKIHPANKPEQLQGCIALGTVLGHASMPVLMSREAERKLVEYMDGEPFVLRVRAVQFVPSEV